MLGYEQHKNEDCWLSVVVIGRNEARRLPELFVSLPEGSEIEWLYIDSRSSDNSIDLALAFGAKVFLVDEDSVYAPGTGRYIGTLEARGRWILYLDGDMVLRSEFKRFLERLRSEELQSDQAKAGLGKANTTGKVAPPRNTAGFVGHTRNLYLDSEGRVLAERDYVVLAKEETGPLENWGKEAHYHGGAVLYRRRAVLEAGNWNPAVYQLEEVDLYSRIKACGSRLRAIDLPMVDHLTPYLSQKDKFLLNFLPRWREKKLYGAGQVVAARLRQGNLLQFIRIYPYPFIIAAGLLTVPLIFIWPLLPLFINLAIAVVIGLLKRKWYFYLVYLGNLLQILRGLGRYRPSTPGYQQIKQ
ncbi:MAG: glycosyltransferase family 2 protein [Bacillota bacterium]